MVKKWLAARLTGLGIYPGVQLVAMGSYNDKWRAPAFDYSINYLGLVPYSGWGYIPH